MIKFTKMHGLGNDYVYMDAIQQTIENESSLARFVSDRHFGIGSDGLILVCKSEMADFKMRMFNADGSEAEMCGNGIRCVGKFVYDKGLTEKTTVDIETLAGIKTLKLNVKEGKVFKKEEKMMWVCRNCGHVHFGESAPEVCPICSHPKAYFELRATNY